MKILYYKVTNKMKNQTIIIEEDNTFEEIKTSKYNEWINWIGNFIVKYKKTIIILKNGSYLQYLSHQQILRLFQKV